MSEREWERQSVRERERGREGKEREGVAEREYKLQNVGG